MTPITSFAISRLIMAVVVSLGFALGQMTPASAQIAGFSSPSPSGSYLAGIEALDGLNTSEAASAFLDAAQSQWDNPAIIERAFVALVADGRVDDAKGLATRMLELSPGHNLAALVLGTIALKEHRYKSAINRLQALGLGNFIDIAGYVVRAWAYVGQSDLNKAFDVLDEMKTSGLEKFLIYHRALMADVAGDPRALDFAKRAYQADQYVPTIVETYARILGNAGNDKAALEVLSAYQGQGLSNPLVLQVRTDIEAGRLPGKFASNPSQGAAELFRGIGAALVRDGEKDIAMVFLRLGLYLNPKDDSIAMAIGNLLDASGRYREANAIYSSISNSSLMKPGAIVLIANNIDAMGNRGEAIRRLENIVAKAPKNLEAVKALGDLLRMDEQYDAAAAMYTKALEIVGGNHPGDWLYFYLRGISNHMRDRWDLAEKDFLSALNLNPDQPQVLNYLGYSWVDMGINLDRALKMIQRAVQSSPRDGYIVDSLGWAIYKLDRFEEAVPILEQAVRLMPNDPEINDHLGDAYWRVGRKLEARFQWKIATAVDTVGDVTKRAAPKLKLGLDAAQSAAKQAKPAS
ncbi:TPR domain protein [hydrothermal vent metagenome]|uniref:TPR domain protein n=1 Tax=hydrothermal vent metagenome TaxID=652676 RepID=A0A3B0TQA0_9ZZZZ